MTTTAIVLHYQREAHTIACVEALLASQPAAPRILVVDNASADGSAERLRARFPQVEHLAMPENLGYAGGNARAIAHALGQGAERVLVINDDATVSSDTLALLERALDADAGLAGVGPTILFDDPASTICWAGGSLSVARALGEPAHPAANAEIAAIHREKDAHPGTAVPLEQGAAAAGGSAPRPPGPRLVPCTFLSGCALLLRAEPLRALGSFREDFWAYGEDVDLSLRLSRAGWRLGWVPAARVIHHTPYPEPPIAPWKLTLRDRNRRRMVAAQYAAAERLRFALWFYPTRAVHLLRYAASGDWPRLKAQWAGLWEK